METKDISKFFSEKNYNNFQNFISGFMWLHIKQYSCSLVNITGFISTNVS